MDIILYYIRDNLVGTHYFIYTFVLLFFMFAIIGYLFKEKYGKLEIILNTSQTETKKKAKLQHENKSTSKPIDTIPVKSVESKPVETNNVVQEKPVITKTTEVPLNNQVNVNQPINPTVIPNIPSQNENPEQIPNAQVEIVTPTPVQQDLTGKIPEIKI